MRVLTQVADNDFADENPSALIRRSDLAPLTLMLSRVPVLGRKNILANLVKPICHFWPVFLAVCLISCAKPHEQENRESPDAFERASEFHAASSARENSVSDNSLRHWKQNAQLRSLMNELTANTQQKSTEDLPSGPQDQRGRRDAMGAARLADALADDATRIPGSICGVKMSEADRAGFEAEADTLRDQARVLALAVRSNRGEQLQPSLDAISATCVSCHSRYRDFAGQLKISGN